MSRFHCAFISTGFKEYVKIRSDFKLRFPGVKSWTALLIELIAVLAAIVYGAHLRFAQVNLELRPAWLHGDILWYYYTPARNILEGRGFFQNNNDFNSPLHAVFFAACMLLRPALDLILMQKIQVWISILGLLAAWIWARLAIGRLAALTFSISLALYPGYLILAPALGTENNYFALFFGTMLCCHLALLKQKSLVLPALTGSLAALTFLQRVNALPLIIPLVGLTLLQALKLRPIRRPVIRAVLMALMFLLPASVWWQHMYKAYHIFLPTIPRSGVVLQTSNFASLDSGRTPLFEDYVYEFKWMDPGIEKFSRVARTKSYFQSFAVSNVLYQEKVGRYIRNHPGHSFRNYAIRWKNQFSLPHQNFSDVKIIGPLWKSWLEKPFSWLLFALLPGLLVYTWRNCERGAAAWLPLVAYGTLVFITPLAHLTQDGRMNILVKVLGFLWPCYLFASIIHGIVWLFRRSKRGSRSPVSL